MKTTFRTGDRKYYSKIVSPEETATFASGQVHPVYATFALARDAEWACRQFVLEMKEENEEGIGTLLHIDHLAPVLVGMQVDFIATMKSMEGNVIICTFEAKVGNRLIARGETGQKVLKKEKVTALLHELGK